MPYIKRHNPKAYPTRKLYLNLLKKYDGEDMSYNFSFLSDDECANDENHFWFPVGDIMGFDKLSDTMKYLSKVNAYLLNLAQVSGEQFDEGKNNFAIDTLTKLWEAVHSNGTISYYLEKSAELDKVLNIFIRVNSGGTPLSYSDLLLSIASAQWDELDVRDEIHKAVDDINAIGRGFNVNKDFVLKACLVLCDFNDIAFKIDNFNRTNMMKIQSEWENIIAALTEAVSLVARLGFSRDNITSNNLFIPIAYYIKQIGLPTRFAASPKNAENVRLIKQWFVSAMFKRVFSFAPDGLLNPIREIIRKNERGDFPLEHIIQRFKGTNRTHEFTDEDVENLLWRKYGQGDTLVIMSILYPWADFANQFHVDHIFPKSAFTVNRLQRRGIAPDKQRIFLDNFNYICNLQLLEGLDNTTKNDKDFKEWFEENLPTAEARAAYCQKHLIPENIDLEFENFPEFMVARDELITQRLKQTLQR